MNKLKEASWSSYLAGGLTGIVLVVTVGLVGGWFGTTTTFARIGSWFVQWTPIIDSQFFTVDDGTFAYGALFTFQTFFVVGILFGAFVAAKMSGEFKITYVPERFEKRFGPSKSFRFLISFIGGFIMVIGARIAGGCASWWGISSSSKLDLAGISTLAFFLMGAIIMNYFFYGKKWMGKGEK